MSKRREAYRCLWEVSVSVDSAGLLDLLASHLRPLSPGGFLHTDSCEDCLSCLVFFREVNDELDEGRADIRRQVLDRLSHVCSAGDVRVQVRRIKAPDGEKGVGPTLQPVQIGPLLVVPSRRCTTGIRPLIGRDEDARCVFIHPGMAFGTGHHASTRLALRAMVAAYSQRRTGRMLDVGCGSGILALSALRLGCREAWACDIQCSAIEMARRNADTNNLSDSLRLNCGDIAGELPDQWPKNYPMVTANINASVLKENAGRLREHTQPGGYLILSGLLGRQQVEQVLRTYSNFGDMCDVLRLTETGWHAVMLQREV